MDDTGELDENAPTPSRSPVAPSHYDFEELARDHGKGKARLLIRPHCASTYF